MSDACDVHCQSEQCTAYGECNPGSCQTHFTSSGSGSTCVGKQDQNTMLSLVTFTVVVYFIFLALLSLSFLECALNCDSCSAVDTCDPGGCADGYAYDGAEDRTAYCNLGQ